MIKNRFQVIRKTHFWIIIIIFSFCVFIHYPEYLPIPDNIKVISVLGLNRHALVRILFLFPVIYSAYVFGLKGGIISLTAALIVMLPRILFISHYPKDALFETLTTLSIGLLINIWLETRRKQIKKEKELLANLRLYSEQIGRAHEEERKHIARELHDEIIQTMIAANRHLDNFITQNRSVYENNIVTILKLQTEINNSIILIRHFIQYLRPPILELLGLFPAIRELCNQVENESDIKITFKGSDLKYVLNKDEILSIYRIIQEALSNVQKHSRASLVKIDLNTDDYGINLTITDNGIGFQINRDQEILESNKLGIIGMKERANLLGGTLKISSIQEKGTIIHLKIPS